MKRLLLCAGAAVVVALGACAPTVARAVDPVVASQQDSRDRLLPLQGVENARDIGGYRTIDGRTVKWDLIYRTAELSTLTPGDIATLNARGVRSVHDLRTVEERQADPTVWTGEDAPQITAIDYTMDMSGFVALFQGGVPTAEQAHELFEASYPEMLLMQRPQHRALFADLLRGEGPVLYHCTAGKDRTGVATALILSALGVPRETILTDYELSNRYFTGHSFAADAEADPAMAFFMQLPEDVRAVFMGVDADYLVAVFDVIDRDYGSVEAYLDREIGVDGADLDVLRALYTE